MRELLTTTDKVECAIFGGSGVYLGQGDWRGFLFFFVIAAVIAFIRGSRAAQEHPHAD